MVSEAQKKAKKKYNEKAYDRIAFDFPKGAKEVLKERASKEGKSMNAYVVHELGLSDFVPMHREQEQE